MGTEPRPEAPAVPGVARYRTRREPAGEPLALPPGEPAATGAVARVFGAAATKPCGCGPDEPCTAHAEAGLPDDTTRARPIAVVSAQERTGAVLPLDREGLREIARNAVANWHSGPAPGEEIADALWPLLEHMQSAAAGSHEGVRLWMLDCGELVQKHRDRADAAEAKLAAQREYDTYRRALWVMVRQFGGSVFLASAQLEDVPPLSSLGCGREPGGLRINAEEEL